MKTIYVKFWDPNEIMDAPFPSEEKLKEICFRVYKYPTEFDALLVYANTMCTWSTLLDETANVPSFIDEAWEHIKSHDIDWLEENFI